MKLADVSIKRPVFATMMIAALVVLGLYSYTQLNVDLFPKIDFPFVVVTTVLPGAGPEQIESDVTKKIEDAVNTVEGIDYVQSYSQENVSVVLIAFKLEVDGKLAAQDVRENVASIISQLPTDVEAPVIKRYDPSVMPIISLSVSGERDTKEITTFTKNVIQKRLENIPGVGAVNLVGGAEREVQIEVDAAKLQSYNLSIQDVAMSIGASNVEIPGGNLTEDTKQVTLRTMGKFKKVEDFNNVIVAHPGGIPVYLYDVAKVVDGIKEQKSLTRLNGKTAVGLEIVKQSGSNTVKVAEEVKKQVEKLDKELPSDIKIVVAQDNSTFIEDAINDVLFDILYGSILAVIVIFLFLANLRATLISAIALPTSIIASFIIMYALDFTLNMMSLLALSLAVGLLIDDAIVVIENIYRHMDEGETPMEAAKSASDEIGLAVLATTFTLVAVFVPIAFMKGIVGRFFYEFGITIASAVLVSLFVAFTLTPMLSSRWLKREDEKLDKEGNFFQKGLFYFNHFFEWWSGKYARSLNWSLLHKKVIVIGSIALFIFSFFLMGFLGSEFLPSSDRSEFFVAIKSAPGSSLNQTSNICAQVETELRKLPEVNNILTTIGSANNPVTTGNILVKLKKKSERERSDVEIMSYLRNKVKYIPGATFAFNVEGEAGNGKPVQFSVRGPNLDSLKRIADNVEQILKSTPGAVDVDNSLELSKPEVKINIDREKAADLGVNPLSLASSIRAMVDGYVATNYQEGEDQIDVRVILNPEDRNNISSISSLSLKGNKTNQTTLVPVSDIANITTGFGPSQINRYDRQKEIRIDANLSGRLLGEVIGPVQKEIGNMNLPAGYTVKVVGQGEMAADSMIDMLLSLMLAILFVYIVLAAQFESFSHPFAIMLALPMSLIGAVLFLLLFKSSMSIMSMIGIIMLMGLVTKNGILLVDFTNVLRDRGMNRHEALVKAGPTRLRPILMTTFAMIFGMLPVALGLGEGSEFRSSMGQAVIGGLITSTLLTLYVVPVVYSILDDLGQSRVFVFFKKLLPKRKRTKEQEVKEAPLLEK